MRQYQTSTPGSVRKRLNRGRWEAVVRYRDTLPGRTDDEGNPVWGPWKSLAHLTDVACYPNSNRCEKAALARMREWRSKLEAEEPDRLRLEAEASSADRIKSTTPLADYVDHYIDHRLPNQKAVERSTLTGYRRRARYVRDHALGSIPLREVTRGDIEGFRDDLAEAKSVYTTHDTVRLVKAALTDAVRAGYIDRSPAEYVSAPLPKRTEPNSLDSGERERLKRDLDCDSDSPAALATLIALHTGMRQGEICGLRWCDVDFTSGTIFVRKSVGRDGEGYYLKDTKSTSSRRDFSIPEALLPYLDKRRETVSAEARDMGVEMNGGWFVTGTFDNYMAPRALAQNWRRRVRRLKLIGTQQRPPTFHDLRHTFATVSVASNVDVKSIASIMGHADTSMTINVYASADPEAKRIAMARIGENI